ncbi:unnamed protein product [Lampetra fluviatilis]
MQSGGWALATPCMEFCMQLYLGVGILLGLAVLSLCVMAFVCIRKKRNAVITILENSEDGTYTGLHLNKVSDETYDTIGN